MKSYWLWNYGDYEIHHTNMVNLRRQEYGTDYPTSWKLGFIENNVKFHCDYEVKKKGYAKLHVKGIGKLIANNRVYNPGEIVELEPGKQYLRIDVANLRGLPAAYLESDVVATDGTWRTFEEGPVGFNEYYDSPDKDPEYFPFEYKQIMPVSRQVIDNGVLFDFGDEMFGYLYINNAKAEDKLHVCYGETVEEATSVKSTLIFEHIEGSDSYKLRQRAFRYVYIIGNTDVTATAESEYLPLEYKGSFRSNDETINNIWDICVKTLHLNTREVLLDGIKRDRWCWGGDAYQSYKFCNYLFYDKEIIKRTTLGLRGQPAMREHINTIMDYSLYWVIGLWDYYFTFGDKTFIKNVYYKATTLMDFMKTRENEMGLLVGKPGDWIFIDWSDIDKTGAVCAEQMLYIEANKTMVKLAKLLGEPYEGYEAKANDLIKLVNEKYWNAEKGGFIDSFESGKENVTRHANIFAVMYDIATADQVESIRKNVLFNDDITKITTPYFEGYELDVMGKLGEFDYIEDMFNSYWKGMIDLGATTVWEEYKPDLTGVAHYEMYGSPFGKSLCHAWGSGPIYLLGRYFLGVYPTDVAYKTFEVKPYLGRFEFIEGTVPVEGGEVKVYLSKDNLEVTATVDGGTVVYKGKTYELEKGKTLLINN